MRVHPSAVYVHIRPRGELSHGPDALTQAVPASLAISSSTTLGSGAGGNEQERKPRSHIFIQQSTAPVTSASMVGNGNSERYGHSSTRGGQTEDE
mmetsp:Transcript_8487/g.16700  ORF Transcript_8487/g.16700 Transcript_8487/m.16700 type:complete len:95 (+) Transcript_8487:556-840(+)